LKNALHRLAEIAGDAQCGLNAWRNVAVQKPRHICRAHVQTPRQLRLPNFPFGKAVGQFIFQRETHFLRRHPSIVHRLLIEKNESKRIFYLQLVNGLLNLGLVTEKKPNKAPERFIRRLEKAMDEHPEKLSLNRIARLADISPAYLSFLLNGKRDVPSNEAIARLEEVLNIPKDELFKAAGRPNDQALEFFRKDEAGAIVHSLAGLPNGRLSAARKLIEKFVKNPGRAK
jgi:transcriptional regulator with XRE-family HTH domain